MNPRGARSTSAPWSASSSSLDVLLAELTARWDRGEAPRVEDYLERLDPGRAAERVELIYRDFCLAEWAGLDPRPEAYLARFPADAHDLDRLFHVDRLLGSSALGLWEGSLSTGDLPEVGHAIGPYRLIRELGRGGLARVFLAEQSDLDDRLVVLKVSTRVTPEPALLARASHPNIVPVHWHGEADDGHLQLICMPFLGGASLAAILAERRRRGAGARSGKGLLDDLDRVAAEGYPRVAASGPCRERIAALSYPGATAWVVARLAEALDFAFGRGVLHGDVKPSNVLLAADGRPLLFDFNLSVGWRGPQGKDAEPLPRDAGGTLAYMAPERLRNVADPSRQDSPSPGDRHRADIFSLGVLLLEMLTGRAPEFDPAGGAGRRLSLQELASHYISSREHGGQGMIRMARRPLPAGLRAILAHCLAPEPADRYRRAADLAEDLDLWLADRPLRHASDPAGASRLARAARRNRRVLAVLATGLIAAAAVMAIDWRRARLDGREAAMSYLESVYSGAFPQVRAFSNRPLARENPAEIARGHLDAYGVLDPRGDWRRRDHFRDLPPSERDELEAWLLEQALRYAHALGDRPDPASWRRALASLEPIAAQAPAGALLAQCRALRAQLGEPEPGGDGAMPAAVPPWMEDYLQGVAAELRGQQEEALGHYGVVRTSRPRAFWARYRAAAVALGQRDYKDAAAYLKACVDRRPRNFTLRLQYAGHLYLADRVRDAVEQCDRAQGLDPDNAETYLTRSFLRVRLRQFQNYASDFNLYTSLTGHALGGPSGPPQLDLTRPIGPGDGLEGRGAPLRAGSLLDPDEAGIRGILGVELAAAQQTEMAMAQFDRVLEIDPGDLSALSNRASLRDQLRGNDAETGPDFARIVRHPKIEALIVAKPDAFQAFQKAIAWFIRLGKPDEAVETARAGVRLADRHRTLQAESYYALAKAYAHTARDDRVIERDVLASLRRAYAFDPSKVRSAYLRDPLFDTIRAELGSSPFDPR